MADTSDLPILILVVALRLFVPLAIPRYPIPAGIAALVTDGVNRTTFQALTKLPLSGYQSYDKALDHYYLSVEYLSILRNWSNLTAVAMSRFLFYYRLVGVLLFELLHIRALLLFFPNTFACFFLFYEVVRLRWNPKRLSATAVVGAAFAIWVFIKVPQEYWIHIAQLDITDTIKQGLFGVPSDTSWGQIVRDNIPFILALIAVMALLIAALYWFVTRRLPPADWSFSFDADAHGSDVSARAVVAAQQALARRLWDAELLEKFVLVSLAVVNALVVAVFVAVLPFTGGSIDTPATLFAVLLLTLLVTLYDRFRPYYVARNSRAASV